MVIAIDGPAGSGKSSTARIVAERLGFMYLDTGAMYRAAALAFQRQAEDISTQAAERVLSSVRIDVRPGPRGQEVLLDGEDVTDDVRTPAISRVVSSVAALAAVRRKLVAEQRRIAEQYREEGGGVVVDGRDIGTVVFPNADVKIFMVADDTVRARRRWHELKETDAGVEFDDVLADVRARDHKDSNRDVAPLMKADDAIELDTSALTFEEQVNVVIQAVRERQNLSSV